MTAFQLASDEVHTWCAGLDIPPETSARLYATLTPGERQRSAGFRRNCWTKKEAYVKARGEGLTMPLNDNDSATRWSRYTFQPAPGYAGALAIEGSGWRLRHGQWTIRAR